ncbi:hypothetical protein PN36_25775 [Candidatus Thiomargarita nelsonii]|uniref:Uncharacterized protein n=1 Tax=Candidatus Thiomargarita nelsonii TaxID=1003181 RepID=A0A0A6P630_9GAMM|nr:hypothetical protein PN36_25775 [Candidatus Thiomargarita nelsonii]
MWLSESPEQKRFWELNELLAAEKDHFSTGVFDILNEHIKFDKGEVSCNLLKKKDDFSYTRLLVNSFDYKENNPKSLHQDYAQIQICGFYPFQPRFLNGENRKALDRDSLYGEIDITLYKNVFDYLKTYRHCRTLAIAAPISSTDLYIALYLYRSDWNARFTEREARELEKIFPHVFGLFVGKWLPTEPKRFLTAWDKFQEIKSDGCRIFLCHILQLAQKEQYPSNQSLVNEYKNYNSSKTLDTWVAHIADNILELGSKKNKKIHILKYFEPLTNTIVLDEQLKPRNVKTAIDIR